jgi:prepilin-type N-terminal cleavage/methylation domain-containing protein
MSPTIARERRAAHGFTLVEVLTAISLLGIIGAIAATNFNAFMPAYRVRGAALEIAGDMNQARLAAVKEGRSYFYVPLAGTQYQIKYQNGGAQTVLKTVDVAKDYPEVQFGATGIAVDPYGNAIASAVPAGPLTFNSDGTVMNAAGVFVESTVEGAHSQHGVVVTAAGRIRVWHFNGSTWQ